jgi:tellurite resistance protein TehA-like permease
VGIPGVIPGMPTGPVVITNVFYWTPQVIGGTGFIVASVLLCLEVQRAWYRPALLSLGWHVGFWNLVGALGFTLCGAFGYAANNATWAEFQSTTSTFWGGWAFLIGSLAQLWEAVYREAPEPAPAPGAAAGDAEKSRA